MTATAWLGNSVAVAQSPTMPLMAQASAGKSNSEISHLIVSPTGNDTVGDGSEALPLKTLTRAMQMAHANTVIRLKPGTYSAQTGEIFPIRLLPGVQIQGDARTQGKNIVIKGGGTFLSPTSASQNITILGANQAKLVGVTVTNPNPRGYGLWIESANSTVMHNTFTANTHDGVSIVGHSNATLQGNYFYKNGANGLTIYGASRPEIRENTFEDTGFGISVAQTAAPILVGNRIRFNKDGIVLQAKVKPILRGNLIEGNVRDGVVAIAEANPDLGTATELGNNIFRNNGRFDLNTRASSATILAYGNHFENQRISGKVKLMTVDRPGLNVQVTPDPQSIPIPVQPTSLTASSFPEPQPQQPRPPLTSPVRLAVVPPVAQTTSQARPTSSISAASFPVPTGLSSARKSNTSKTMAQPLILPAVPELPVADTSIPPLSFSIGTLPVQREPIQPTVEQPPPPQVPPLSRTES
ncbi:MAG: DUF1565 domain-containing protein, partial [Leptolyngbyaceae bacterium]|nr:DUF1565 domain-containing protein [Leptolyngbyaceae bacterium]